MRRVLLPLAVLLAAVAFAQEPGTRVPSVELAPVGKVQVKAGGSAAVQLDFRVGSEFHINSNKPHSELLIPTVLKLSPTNPVAVAGVKYPDGQDMSFPFAPDEKLSVYSGDFTIAAVIKAPANAPSGNFPVTGTLRFQACDRSACYPPRSIPVNFNVSVVGR
ncbi:MAG: disulfide bond formation protein DsbC [Candidatus Korobacteraceae bacterium]